MFTAQPIVRRKLADEVRDRLLEMMQSGELHPGDRLPSERELMTRFGVGRPAVREALQSLGSAGLIQINHGERARITVPDTRNMFERMSQTMQHLLQTSPKTLTDLWQSRMLFETGMIKIAAQKATPEDVAGLQAALERQRAAVDNIPEFVRADMAFHTAIVAVSGNSVCVALSEAMLDWLFRFRRDMVRVPGTETIAMEEHQRMIDAIAAHDLAAAEAAIVDHMSRSNARYREMEEAMTVRVAQTGNPEP